MNSVLCTFSRWSTWEATHNISAFTDPVLWQPPSNAAGGSLDILQVASHPSYRRNLVLAQQPQVIQSQVFWMKHLNKLEKNNGNWPEGKNRYGTNPTPQTGIRMCAVENSALR